MQTILAMRQQYIAEQRPKPFHALLQIGDDGLILGRGTVVAPGNGALNQHFDTSGGERVLALLSATYGRQVAPSILKYVARAAQHWRDGDGALAHIELAFARLPRLETEDDAFRLFLAECLLAQGLAPRELARGLGFDPDLLKYDPAQPRVPAGNGRPSGRWGSNGGSSALLGLPSAAAQTAGRSFLVDASPAIVRALAAFATRFSVPTAVLGALFIPTPNSGSVTEGTLPDAPQIAFRRDGPAGTLRLATTAADGSEMVVVARSQHGVYVDVATKEPLGRDFGEQLYLDLGTVVAALAPRDKGTPAAVPQGPELCPAPEPDTPHGQKQHILDYEDDVHARVNPLAPIPRGFAVRVIDPLTGEWQYPDDCFRYAGDLVDGDMQAGDLADAKGEEYTRLLLIPGVDKSVMDGLVDQAKRHLRAAKARGAHLKIYFAEQRAVDLVLDQFSKDEELSDVAVGFLPPSRPK